MVHIDPLTLVETTPLHPIHKNCLKRWLIQKATCPSCQLPLNFKDLFSRKERFELGARSFSKAFVINLAFTTFCIAGREEKGQGILPETVAKAIRLGVGVLFVGLCTRSVMIETHERLRPILITAPLAALDATSPTLLNPNVGRLIDANLFADLIACSLSLCFQGSRSEEEVRSMILSGTLAGIVALTCPSFSLRRYLRERRWDRFIPDF